MNNSVVNTYYINPTAKGVYRTVINGDNQKYTELIKKLLRYDISPPLTKRVLFELFDTREYEEASKAIQSAQTDGFIRLLVEPRGLPNLPSEQLLHDYIKKLFSGFSALLVNEEGFELVNSGFDQQQTAAFSAITGALIGFQENRVKPLIDNDIIKSKIWKICDFNGKAEVSFYPFESDRQKFMLVTKGGMLLNHVNLTDLARLLFIKY